MKDECITKTAVYRSVIFLEVRSVHQQQLTTVLVMG